MAAAGAALLSPHISVRGFDSLSVLHRDDAVLVLRGRQRETNQPVILKTRHSARSAGFHNIAQEYELLKRLSTSGATVEPLAYISEEGLDVLVLKEIPDAATTSGAEYLNINGALDVKSFFSLAVALANSLGRIHSRQIVHGDVKPGNFLYSSDKHRVQFFDFDLAFSFHTTISSATNAPRGTFPYLAPECTGRIGVALDCRSDLYSLGVTFFQMLTDTLPFQRATMSEQLHAILTEQPPLVTVLMPSLPRAVASIVERLLQKDPEARYQSAYGVWHDLLHCQEEYAATGAIAPFELGTRDVVTTLRRPTLLYGRDKEVQQVKKLSSQVRKARVSALFIRGDPGSGKSSFMRMLPAVVDGKPLFGRGRFEQAPFKAIGTALAPALQRILAMDETMRRPYAEHLRRELGANASLLYQLVPGLQSLIGVAQTHSGDSDELPANAILARFADTLVKLIICCATRERPLVLCIDDMQWADHSSLGLIAQVIASIQNSQSRDLCLLFVGAYRTADPGTPLVTETVQKMREAGLATEEMELHSLTRADLLSLLRDVFPASHPHALDQLCEVVLRKTLGNAFFVQHFLEGIYQDGMARFDFDAGVWLFDMAGIEAARFTDNVASFLSQRLSMRPDIERQLLFAVACFGTEAPLNLLRHALQMQQVQFDAAIDSLTSATWLVLTGNIVSFSHDNLRCVAYAQLSAEHRHATHFKLAQLLLGAAQAPPSDSELFAIVQQFNKAEAAIPRDQHHLVVSLHLNAWERARATGAYDTARDAALAAFRIIEKEESWWPDPNRREHCFRAALAVFSCQTDLGQHKEADATYAYLLRRSERKEERVAAWQQRADQLEMQSRWEDSIAVRAEILALMGQPLPLAPSQAETQQIVQEAVAAFVARRAAIDSFPLVTGRAATVLTCLSQLVPATFHVAPAMFAVVTAKLVSSSLQSGQLVPAFPVGLVGLATSMLAAGQYKLAIEMSRVAQAEAEKLESGWWRFKTYLMMLSFTKWIESPFDSHVALHTHATKLGTESGDVVAACFLAYVGTVVKLCAGVPLSRLESECEVSAKWLTRQVLALPVQRNIGFVLGVVSALTGNNTTTLADTAADPSTYDVVTRGLYWTMQLMRSYLLERYQDAYVAAQNAKPSLIFIKTLCWSHILSFYYLMTLFALYPSADEKTREMYRSDIKDCMEQFEILATHAPCNFLAMHLLARAESVRVLQAGPAITAIQLYDEALQHAKKQGLYMLVGLISEHAGLFYLSLNASTTAHSHFCAAYQAFMEWGAMAKVRALVSRLPFVDFSAPATSSHKASSGSSPSITNNSMHAQMDVESVVKASRVLTTELSLGNILNNVMSVIIENSAAERAFIMIPSGKDRNLEIAARHENAASGDRMSRTALGLVMRDKTVLLAENAAADPRFIYDEYVQEKRVRSLLCLPMYKKDELQGIVYLENNSFSGAFVSARVPILCVIVQQLSGSIENASMVLRLMEYSQELEKRNEELTRLDRLKSEFLATTTHELRTPLNAMLGTTSLLLDTPLSEEQLGYVRTVERSAQTQLHLINDLLDTSKIQAGKLRIREAPFSLQECIETALEMVAPAAAEKELELAYRINCKGPDMVTGDARRLQQIMLNLLSNAVKFTEEGSVELVVQSCEAASGGERIMLVFEVRDTGIGIPPAQIGELFSLFTQLDSSSTRRYEGSGLGLYLTARLVSLMSGAISVSSDGMHGSTFHVQLLLHTASVVPPLTPPALSPLAGKHVLLLAVSDANRQLFAQQLPCVSATLDAVAVDRQATALPSALTQERISSADIIVAELGLIAPLVEYMSSCQSAGKQAVVPLTTALGWTRYKAKPANAVPLLKPLSHVSLLRMLAHSYGLQTRAHLQGPVAIGVPSSEKQPPGPKAKILVVDDNAVNNKVLCQILTKSNYACQVAFNGVEAITSMKKDPADIVLMDVLMPVMDGVTCTRELRRLGYNCPIVAVSATINEEACLEAGVSDFLHKPITKTSVVAMLEKWLSQAQQ